MRLALTALLLAVALPGAARAQQLVDGIAAQVGAKIVLVSDVREVAAPTEIRARAQGASDADIRQLYAEVLEQMIERALIQQLVQRAEISASEADVDEAIASIAQENDISPEKLRETVEAQGMPYPLYRDRIRSEIEHARVLNDLIASKVRVDDDELQAIYDKEVSAQPEGGEEFFLRVIVVTRKGDQPGSLSDACDQVDAAKARIDGGETFDAVAREVSEANPESGGAQGWVHQSELAGWMQEPVKELQPGDVSDRISAGFGCGLVQVVERRAFVPLPYEQAKEGLFRVIFDERMAAEYKKLVERLRAQTYIERKGIFGEADGSARPRASRATATEPGF